MTQTVTEIPLMKQYEEMKRKHPDAILLFRVNDYYEMFGEDAVSGSQILGIVLTRRANGSAERINIAGFPHHALDTYLPRLVRAGRRVAICEPIEDTCTTRGCQNSTETAPQLQRIIDGSILLLEFLTELYDVNNKLYLFEEIRNKTKELIVMATRLGVSPRLVFEECSKIAQPSLFD